jgi:hypothetical protein
VVLYGTSRTASGARVGQLVSGSNTQFPRLITFVDSSMSGQASNRAEANLFCRVVAQNPDVEFTEIAIKDSFKVFAPTVNDIAREGLSRYLDRSITTNDWIDTREDSCEAGHAPAYPQRQSTGIRRSGDRVDSRRSML